MSDKKDNKENKTFGSVYTAGALNLNAAKNRAQSAQFDFNTLLKPIAEVVATRAETVKTAREQFEKNKPEDYNVQLLDGALKERFTVFAEEMKDEYNIAAQTATAYSSKTNSPEYKEAVKRMEQVKTALEKNYNGLKGYQEDRSNRIQNSGREVSMGLEDQTINDLIISEEGYNYIMPTIDGPVWNDGQEGSENRSLGDLTKPDYMDGESATLITNTYISNPIANANNGQDPELFKRNLKNSTFEIINDKALVRRITFNGLSNDPDTRFIDYYVAEQSLLGNLPDVGIIDVNDDGKIDASDRGENGMFTFENNDSSKFEQVIENLKNDKTFDPSKELGIFLEKIGNDKFEAARQAKDDAKIFNLDSYGKVNKKGLTQLFNDINDGKTLSDQNNRQWRKTDAGWVTTVNDSNGNEVDSAPVSTNQMYKHLDLTLHAEEFGYDINGNPLESDNNDFNTTSNESSNTGAQESNGGDNNTTNTNNQQNQTDNLPPVDNRTVNPGANYLDEETKAQFFNGELDVKKGNRVAKAYVTDLVNSGFDLFGQEGDLTPTDYQYIMASIDPMGENFSIETEMTEKEKKQSRADFLNTGAGIAMQKEMGPQELMNTLNNSEGVYYKVTKTVEPSKAFDKWLAEFEKKSGSKAEGGDGSSFVAVDNKAMIQSIQNTTYTKSEKKKLKENHIQSYVVLTNPKNRSYGTLSVPVQLEMAEEVIAHLLQENTLEELENGSLESPWYSYKATPAKKYKDMVELREKLMNS